MLSPFHVSKVQSDGGLHWVEGAVTVERATARVKALAASSPGAYVITNLTGKKISAEFPAELIMFQIGYEEKGLDARAGFFRRCGYEVISVVDNEAAKRALPSIPKVDVFIIGHTAPEQTKEEMVEWLKANFPKVKIVALISPGNRQVPRADYNIVLDDWDKWPSRLAAAAS